MACTIWFAPKSETEPETLASRGDPRQQLGLDPSSRIPALTFAMGPSRGRFMMFLHVGAVQAWGPPRLLHNLSFSKPKVGAEQWRVTPHLRWLSPPGVAVGCGDESDVGPGPARRQQGQSGEHPSQSGTRRAGGGRWHLLKPHQKLVNDLGLHGEPL